MLFLGVAVIGGIYGLISGSYAVPEKLAYLDGGMISHALNSAYIRPVFEYFIYVYYFVYFVVLPKYFLKDDKALRYFFRIFSAAFIASFTIGWADIMLRAAGTELYLPREIFSDLDIGMRYHGFAGEPRDAVVYLFFGLAMLHLRELVTGQKLTKRWVVGIVAAVLMTQSASGLVGVVFFMLMYGARKFSSSLTLRKAFLALMSGTGIVLLLYAAVSMSPRIQLYMDVLADAYEILTTGGDIPPLLAVQANNILPVYMFVMNVGDFNWWPVLFGSGLGSASSVNLFMGETFGLDIWAGVTNPNSQLVRLVFETGLVGSVLFYRAFVSPLEHLAHALGKTKVNEFVLLMLLVLGCFFAHRSSVVFIYLGIFIAVMSASPGQRHSFFTQRARIQSSLMAPYAGRA